jgi:hypothetical protein
VFAGLAPGRTDWRPFRHRQGASAGPCENRGSRSGATEGVGPSLGPFRDHVVAGVAAEHLDGGVDRQSREFAELLHHSVALLATSQAILIRPVRRNIRVVRRHHSRPSVFRIGSSKPVRRNAWLGSPDSATEPGLAGAAVSIRRFRNQPDPEHRRPGFVQKLHLPFRIFLQVRAIPPTPTPQTRVSSFQAASRSASSVR